MRFSAPGGEQEEWPYVEPHLEGLRRAGHELAWYERPATDLAEWIDRARGATGFLLGEPLPRGVLAACPEVRVLSCASTGIDGMVPADEVAAAGALVCNVPHYGDGAIAEHALALALNLARGVSRGDREVRAGRWEPRAGVELQGKALGVLGLGGIGLRMLAIGEALGMETLAWSRNGPGERLAGLGAEGVGLEELFQRSDLISLHLPLADATAGIVSAELLARVKPGAILVNTARAGLIDEAALIDALDDGRLRGAGLDVFDEEPLPADSPLRARADVVLTPHVAYYTPEAARALYGIAIDNLIAFAAGAPQNLVEIEA
jgi:phosphoglycerate dehydrogenase-like enzyme